MKRKLRMVFMALTILMVLGNLNPVSAAAETTNEFKYLKEAIETIDAVPSEEREKYMEENREWIDEIGVRLESYVESFPEEQQNDVVDRLLTDSSMAQIALLGNLDEYFNDVWTRTYGGYYTYSMEPKWSVRLWGPTMRAAWDELESTYAGIRIDNGSLWRQYKCHWDYDVFGALAGSWDLEVGRPIVSDSEMFASRCNPE
ncbi:DUF2599 domain-containing protein [Oceanobacillus kapialis]|uniref:DUF2599 domain-containing protein n=1 Tax=Oceanobacillus kapialis TaxID=481353 RepID=A0ABW5PXE6_9BACI